MSRAKVTFREGKKMRRKPQPLVWEAGEHSSDRQLKRDEENPNPRLAEIIQTARDNYAQSRTPSQDVRETLRALSKIDDEHAARAVRAMDDFTQAEFATAANRIWRRENGNAALPDDLFAFETWTPERIRNTAKEARKGMRPQSGRASKASRDNDLAVALARWWIDDHGGPPSVTREKGGRDASPFLLWAKDRFIDAGRSITADALAPILRKAIRQLPRKP